jgi:hypothetical protein
MGEIDEILPLAVIIGYCKAHESYGNSITW